MLSMSEVQELMVSGDNGAFFLHPEKTRYERAYVPGEVPGLLFPIGTIVTVVKRSETWFQRYLAKAKGLSTEDFKAHRDFLLKEAVRPIDSTKGIIEGISRYDQKGKVISNDIPFIRAEFVISNIFRPVENGIPLIDFYRAEVGEIRLEP